jgi:hypothetical protein
MGHSVQLLIGKDAAVDRFFKRWPGSRVVELNGGWQAIPMEGALYAPIELAHPGAVRPGQLDVSPLGLEEAMIEATREGGGLAYVETDYFGGSGGQSAMAMVDGVVARQPERSRGAGGPINSALRAIGVERLGEMDEFDSLGLGERRSMSDYEPDGPGRLRGAIANPTPVSEVDAKGTLPGWVVILLVAAFVGIGILVSQVR